MRFNTSFSSLEKDDLVRLFLLLFTKYPRINYTDYTFVLEKVYLCVVM